MTRATIWRGADALRPNLVPLSGVQPHPQNPKDHDLGAIASSLARFGQLVPILVQRSTGFIVAGNGRWEAVPMVAELETALEVGPGEPWTHIAAITVDLTDAEALAYALADNRTHDLGGYREDVLARVLGELAGLGPDALLGTGYDLDDYDNLVASLRPSVPFDVPGMTEPELRSEVIVEIRCSRAFLDGVDGDGSSRRSTLAEWGEEDGVEVSIA